MWNASEILSHEKIERLKKEFLNWLKEEKGMVNQPNIKVERNKRWKALEEIIKSIHDPTLNRILDQVKNRIKLLGDADPVLKDIEEFLEWIVTNPGKTAEESEDESSEEWSETVERENERKIIGRVAPTIKTPTTPFRFTFWVKDDEDVHVEVGNIVTARHPRGNLKVTGIVSDLQATSDVPDVIDSFYGHVFGRPEEDVPTRITTVLSATVEVVRRSDNRMEPIRGFWPVMFASAEEIQEAYGSDIPADYRVLAGFTYDDKNNPVPIFLDARYILGYEAAHVNISGASGVATKTSYALFLIYSILAYGEKQKEDSVAAIAFNVKEADLMFIDKLPEWEELEGLEHHNHFGKSVRLWTEAKKHGIDPIKWVKDRKIRFFAPQHFQGRGVLSNREQDVEAFNYSLRSILEEGPRLLFSIFDPEDLDEKAVALIMSMAELAKEENLTFESLIEKLRKEISEIRNERGKRSDWFSINGVPHHKLTGYKILNRLNHILDNQLKGVVVKSESTDHPIPLENLKPGDLWVIDITRLSDKGQRLIFQAVVHKVFRILERRKSSTNEFASFPKHVLIFVDELNKFVPAGREFSIIKGDIVEIAARGRSFGFCLCGAQQLASKIDEEVIANTSTFVVGRSHPVEIHKTPYGWLPEGLKQKAIVLEKGNMLLWHAIHKRPVLVHFPIPLHRLKEEMDRRG